MKFYKIERKELFLENFLTKKTNSFFKFFFFKNKKNTFIWISQTSSWNIDIGIKLRVDFLNYLK
jgi:hypothetical protein